MSAPLAVAAGARPAVSLRVGLRCSQDRTEPQGRGDPRAGSSRERGVPGHRTATSISAASPIPSPSWPGRWCSATSQALEKTSAGSDVHGHRRRDHQRARLVVAVSGTDPSSSTGCCRRCSVRVPVPTWPTSSGRRHETDFQITTVTLTQDEKPKVAQSSRYRLLGALGAALALLSDPCSPPSTACCSGAAHRATSPGRPRWPWSHRRLPSRRRQLPPCSSWGRRPRVPCARLPVRHPGGRRRRPPRGMIPFRLVVPTERRRARSQRTVRQPSRERGRSRRRGQLMKTRIRRGFDAVSVLTVYLALLLLIESRLVIGPLGGAGSPAMLVALGALVWWALHHLQRSLPSRAGPQPLRAVMLATLLAFLAAMSSRCRGRSAGRSRARHCWG